MCWACYTSLSGGASALAGAAAGGPASAVGKAPMGDTEEKKKIDPKHLAIIGVGLLVALGFGAKTMMGSGSEGETLPEGGFAAPTKAPPNPAPPQPPPPAAPVGVAASPPTGGEVAAAGRMPFQFVASPNIRYAGATAAIVPTVTDAKVGEAKALAGMAHTQLNSLKKFAPVEIFVFNDERSARVLAMYQSKRRGAPLTSGDYQSPELVAVWKEVLVRYKSEGGRQSYSYPKDNPSNFWMSSARG